MAILLEYLRWPLMDAGGKRNRARP